MANHDGGYKLLFSHSKMVEALLRGFVREGWISNLEFSTLEKVGGSFVSDDLRERHSDTIWRLRWRGPKPGWFYVYLLLEFQSTPDPFMPVRLQGYVALLWEELIRSKTATVATGLPLVLPLVLYNGRRPWKAPLDLASLFRAVPPGAEHLVPQLQYLLIDENRLGTAELALPGNLAASLFQLETCTPEDLPRLTAGLAALLPRGREERLRHAFAEWLLRLLHRLAPGATIPETADLEEMPMLEETLREWFDGARKEGLQVGLQEGRQEGRIEGMRQMLLGFLEERFGRLPQRVRRKVVALASSEELQRLLSRSFTAGSLEELGLQ
ncbi:MAG TPA: Rpn family recombination-promoting nuclease/putative transposase [Thermoanaerobaculia bacterium]|nr:Rpn family recombination-promoting nuclease/putative transposase [Thermoanaerobaculia bacterium]